MWLVTLRSYKAMVETIDKAWINLWLPELNEPQVTMLLAQIDTERTKAGIEAYDKAIKLLEDIK